MPSREIISLMSELPVKLVGIVGSLRKDSFNKKLMVALAARMPARTTLAIVTLEDIPLFNADRLDPEPKEVRVFKEKIASADGVILSTPEYNYGIPGVLKNALDWASRPAYQSVFAQKPVTMMGASLGPVGTARAQGQLKQVLLGMASDIYPVPEQAFGLIANKLNDHGEVVEETLEKSLTRFANGFREWVTKRMP